MGKSAEVTPCNWSIKGAELECWKTHDTHPNYLTQVVVLSTICPGSSLQSLPALVHCRAQVADIGSTVNQRWAANLCLQTALSIAVRPIMLTSFCSSFTRRHCEWRALVFRWGRFIWAKKNRGCDIAWDGGMFFVYARLIKIYCSQLECPSLVCHDLRYGWWTQSLIGPPPNQLVCYSLIIYRWPIECL